MSRVTVQSLSKSYGGEELFRDLSFEAGPGMRLAVTGPNGCGKSTLLRIIAGEAGADTGEVALEKGARLGYVAQDMDEAALDTPLLTWVLSALPSWADFWQRWEAATEARDQAALERLGHEQAEFEAAWGYNPEHRARAILTGLGFAEGDELRLLRTFSGGWRERAKLGRVLLQGADVLLLDEPTNHLDLEAVEWLERYLLDFSGTLVFVAHDRVFLERVGSHVLFLGGGRGVMRKGTFSEFAAWDAENAERLEREAAKLEGRIEDEMSYIRRFRVKARKASQAQSKLKKVERLQEELADIKRATQAQRPGRTLSFSLPEPRRGGKVACAAVGLRFHYDDGRCPWTQVDFQLFRGHKVALLAPNGAGKTTLLKCIAGELTPTAGHVKLGQNTDMAYFSQHQTEILRTERTVLGEVRRLSDKDLTEEQLMGVLGLFLLGESYFDRKVSGLSGGEKSRLVLATLFLRRANFLLLDEPTNHLDLESREGLVRALKDYQGTLLMVAHDRYLLSEVAREVWTLDENGVTPHLEDFAGWQEKRRAQEAGTGARVSPRADDGKGRDASPPPAAPKLGKEDKRRQAEERNRRYRAVKPKRDAYAKLEKELEGVLEEQAEVEARLNDPALYDEPGKALEANARYREVSEYAESLMERMAALEDEISALERT